MWAHSEKVPFRSWGEGPHRKPTLLAPWFWTFSCQNCEKVSFKATQSVMAGILLWQSGKANTISQSVTESCWFFLCDSPCNHCFLLYLSHCQHGTRSWAQMNAKDFLKISGFVLSYLLLIFPATDFYLAPFYYVISNIWDVWIRQLTFSFSTKPQLSLSRTLWGHL